MFGGSPPAVALAVMLSSRSSAGSVVIRDSHSSQNRDKPMGSEQAVRKDSQSWSADEDEAAPRDVTTLLLLEVRKRLFAQRNPLFGPKTCACKAG